MTSPHALIAGAGIGGLTAALSLARAGWRVSLFEKSEVLEETGAGLQLSPNATSVLRGLGLLPALLAAGLSPTAVRIRRARDGATLASLPLNEAEKRWGSPYLVIHRADLQKLLLAAISKHPNIRLRLGTVAAGFATEQDSVTLAVKRGVAALEYKGDCLIGADGLHSFIRQRLVGGNLDALRFSGKTAWRALIPADALPHSLTTQETQLWLGPNAHFVHYRLRQGSLVNAVAIINDPTGFNSQQDPWSNPGDVNLLANSFVNWDGAIKKLVHATQNWSKWPLFERNRLLGWTVGRVTLLGDAAHPMMPFLAQGSKKQAEIYHLKGVPGLARDLAMRMLGPNRLLSQYDWLYRPRIIHKDP